MKLRYILGSSGCGKTEMCLKEIIKKQNEGKNNSLIYIVPEQFSLQSEKDLILRSKSKTLINIQVLSFKRLAFHLFSETGGVNKKILEDTGKIMLLGKIVFELKDKLTYFTNSINKQGFLDTISSSISEFFQYNISVEALEDSLERFKDKENIYYKMYDLYLIYKEYIKYIRDEYISTDETLDILSDKIPESNLIKDAEIWIDGFNGFTPQEFKVISQLFKKVKQINITLCINKSDTYYPNLNIFDPFFEIKNTINKLGKISYENHITIEKPILLSENKRLSNNPELLFLEKNYFSYVQRQYNDNINNIHIISALNKYSEIRITAINILKLVRDKNYHFNDIAVILGTPDYEKPIKGIFGQFKIPYFMDSKKGIVSHPLSVLISSIIDIVVTNWSYESVFRFLKTGLTPISDEEINILENYVLAYGIKGNKWNYEHWDFGFKNNNQNNEFDENDINYIKSCVVDILSPFTSEIKRKNKYTIKQISYKIFDILYSMNVTSKISEWIETAKQQSNNLVAREHSQIWPIITDIFDKMIEILGNEKITINEYSKILNSGFSGCDMGLIPPSQDQIIIGDIERTRLPNIKALFILAVNDGIIPSFVEENKIFSDSEKEFILKNGLELSSNSKQQLNKEQFLIYNCLTKPCNELFMSYSTGDLDGKPKRPSSIISRIKAFYPNLKEQLDTNINNTIEQISIPTPTFENMVKILYSYSNGVEIPDIYKDTYSWFLNNEEFMEKLISIEDGLFKNEPLEYLTPRMAKKLYTNEIQSSVSRLEKFAQCPFSFFIQYGLKAKERKLYQINPIDFGNVFHNVLEDFSVTLKNNNINWRELDKTHIDKMVENSIDKIVPSMGNEILLSTPRYKYMIKKVKRITKRSVWALSEHIKSGMFEPFDYEIGFGAKEKLPPIIIELSDGGRIILTGKIDRIDILDSNDNKYVKIIDYKSGNKKYDLTDIYYGMQLQLILYLDAFIKKGNKILDGNILPGGMFYFKIDDPIINADKILNADDVNDELLKIFKLSGLVLNEKTVIEALDKDVSGYSKLIPVYVSNDGNVSQKLSSVADLESFNNLREYVSNIIRDIGDEIIKGSVKIYPYKKGKKTGCDYCLYKSICKFETTTKENKYRIIKPLENPWENIKASINKKDEN